MTVNEQVAWTSPDNRGTCGFCGKEENGYAKKGSDGNWRAACWLCVKPDKAITLQPQRKKIGAIFTEEEE